jgi:single-stranded-DNA-specific exonuclease
VNPPYLLGGFLFTISFMQPTIPTPNELEDILIERLGLSEEEKNNFLYPKYELGDPFAFSDMEVAVKRIYKAIKNKEHIGIYSDYDCDGIPGAVVLLDLFKVLKTDDLVHVYIPDRHDEGYGVNTQGIDEFESKKVRLKR